MAAEIDRDLSLGSGRRRASMRPRRMAAEIAREEARAREAAERLQ